MIEKDGTAYVTVAISRDSDGSIGILLLGYTNRIIVTDDSKSERGHGRLHIGLGWVLESAQEG